MASSSKLQAAGNELRVGCEIETVLSLRPNPDFPNNQKPSGIVNVAKFLCKEYGKLSEDARGTVLHPKLDTRDLPYTGPIYQSWILTEDSTLKGGDEKKGECKYFVHTPCGHPHLYGVPKSTPTTYTYTYTHIYTYTYTNIYAYYPTTILTTYIYYLLPTLISTLNYY